MVNRFYLITVLFLFLCFRGLSQPMDALQQQIQHIISARHAVVGVAITGNHGKDSLTINGNRHFPLQSVFKFHIALAVLSEIDKGKLSFNQKLRVEPQNTFPRLYSPIREKYPKGATLTIAEILRFTIAESDNVGCDMLLKLMGGPDSVEAYFRNNNFKDISIKINEETQQANWDLQFQNWTTPESANEVLAGFYFNRPALLSNKSYRFIWNTMKATATGKDRLKGLLPKNTIVAHKTGSSGVNKEGITGAINDMGIVFLPNGRYFFISVFVTNSTETTATNERIIADISKLAWDYFMNKPG